jgi:hypothetical protein
MENICIIPTTMRTGSTYLNKYLAKYNEHCFLGEFFNILCLYRPYKIGNYDYPELVFNIDNEYTDHEIFRLLNSSESDFKKYKQILKKNWKDEWFFIKYFLDDNNKIKYKYVQTNDNGYIIDKALEYQKNLIINSKESNVFKIFPIIFEREKLINIEFLEKLKPNLKIIFLERKNILDICISMMLADYYKVYNVYDKMEQQEIKQYSFVPNAIYYIFNNLKAYYLLKRKIEKDFNCITIQHEDLFNDEKMSTLINKNVEVDHSFLLPKKLYKKYDSDKRLDFLLNKNEFIKLYEKQMIELEIIKKGI